MLAHSSKQDLSSASEAPAASEVSSRFSAKGVVAGSLVLGMLSFGIFLACHNIADGDLWAKLALGAHVWHYGALPEHDSFAFTPVLPKYVDHEWGAGTIFFGFLKFFGPGSLMCLKMALAFGAVLAALRIGRRSGCGWTELLVLSIPSAACISLGYIPVIRSHTFTYFFFGLLLFWLETILARSPGYSPYQIRETNLAGRGGDDTGSTLRGSRAMALYAYPGLAIVFLFLLWINVHGGVVAGLGTLALYTTGAFLQELKVFFAIRKQTGYPDRTAPQAPFIRTTTLLLVCIGSLLVTCLNPYGIRFWSYLLPAVLAKRSMIAEWQPLSPFGSDAFLPFRVLFVFVAAVVLVGWSRVERKSWSGLLMLGVTAFLAWRSRRHAPFFGVAALAFAGPYCAAALALLKELLCRASTRASDAGRAGGSTEDSSRASNSVFGVLAVYALIAVYAAAKWLPGASFQVLAPVGHDPVREADILSLAQATGNLATPFHWGSYAAWRLHPKLKISMDGRYEAAFPESTFLLNARFFDKTGPDWDRLLRDYPVDYVLLDLTQPGLRPEDLIPRGYVLIWKTEGASALLSLERHSAALRQTASSLPPTTIDPLDPALADRWWAH